MDRYAVDLQQRKRDFLSALLAAGGDTATYDVRVIGAPDPANPSAGEVALALLIRLDGTSAAQSEGHARECLRLLQATFPEGEWELVGATEALAIARPFEPNDIVRIGRRVELVSPDSLRHPRTRPPVTGFEDDARRDSTHARRASDRIAQVMPFLADADALANICRVLLLEQTPLALSLRFRATTATAEELSLAETQVVTCERMMQIDPGDTSRDPENQHPVLRHLLGVLLEQQTRRLLGLRAGVCLVQIEIASPSEVPALALAAIATALSTPEGSEVSDAAGSRGSGLLSGGYDIARATDLREAAVAFQTADIALPQESTQPGIDMGRLRHLIEVVDAAKLFLLPPPPSTRRLAGVESKTWRTVPAPAHPWDDGTPLGVSEEYGVTRPVLLGWPDRLRHLYVVGQTGTGKSTLLLSRILADIAAGAGVCVMDPHGDLYRDILHRIPAERADDVVLIDPTDTEYPVAINPLDCATPEERYFVAELLLDSMLRYLADDFGKEGMTWAGPLFQQHVKMNLLLVMSDPERKVGSLLDFYEIFQHKNYWQRWVPRSTRDTLLMTWIGQVLPAYDYTKVASEGTSMGTYISSKFERLLFNPILRNIFGQRRRTVNFEHLIAERKIVLVNLAKGELGEGNSRFVGMVLLGMLQAAVLARARLAQRDRSAFYLYVDEFHSVATSSFVTLLSEGRKFGIGLTLANQFLSQIKDERIIDAVFGNVGTMVAFRLGPKDAESIERRMIPSFNRHDLVQLPNWHACVSLMYKNTMLAPFSVRTTAIASVTSTDTASRIIAQSRARYARPREEAQGDVSAEIMAYHLEAQLRQALSPGAG
ncbi:MAG: hypothetical protein ABS52_07785 [Gemmatimonadetes bacterium SCN 70-22]|nr:MAG: hypothetical protein ABS52_07785 [Gemmatimonadetes bacterium SCN 70-22]